MSRSATVQPNAAALGFDIWLSERLWAESPSEEQNCAVRKVMPDAQYRVHTKICASRSKEFYVDSSRPPKTAAISRFHFPVSHGWCMTVALSPSKSQHLSQGLQSLSPTNDLCKLLCPVQALALRLRLTLHPCARQTYTANTEGKEEMVKARVQPGAARSPCSTATDRCARCTHLPDVTHVVQTTLKRETISEDACGRVVLHTMWHFNGKDQHVFYCKLFAGHEPDRVMARKAQQGLVRMDPRTQPILRSL